MIRRGDRKDPVLDSEAFQRALTLVLLADRVAYRATVLYFFDGLKLADIAKEMHVSIAHISRLLSKSKTILREQFEKDAPHLLDLPAFVKAKIEEFSRAEAEEVRQKFPFVNPHKGL